MDNHNKSKYIPIMKLMIILIISFNTVSVYAFEGGYQSLGKNELINKFNQSSVFEASNNIINSHEGNDKSEMSYGLGDNIQCFIEMYEITNEISYLDTALYFIEQTMNMRDDNRGVVTYIYLDTNLSLQSPDTIRTTLPLWRNLRCPKYYIGPYPKEDHLWEDSLFIERYSRSIDNSSNVKINLDYADECFAAPYVVHTALIIQPMIYFARILDRDSLWGKYDIINSRDNYLSEIMKSINAHDAEWYDFGTYKTYAWLDHEDIDLISWRIQINERTEQNKPISTNYYSSMGTALLLAYGINNNENYKTKAYELAKTIKNSISVDLETNSLCWPYRYNPPGTNEYGPEDVSHARISYKFIYEYYQATLSENMSVFNDEDIDRLVNTFMKKMFLGDIDHYEWIIRDDTHVWEYIEKDNIYDISGLISGDSYDSISSASILYKYYTNYGRQSILYWLPLCVYDPRIYEIGYNICSETNFRGIKNLLYYYEDYQPCIITSNSDSVLCNHTEDLEIIFNNIRILGDLVVNISQNGEEISSFRFTNPYKRDTIWTASTVINDFRTDKTDPIVIKYYSDNNGILGPMRTYAIPITGQQLYVTHDEEIPVLKHIMEEITVRGINININDTLKMPPISMPGCTVKVDYANDSSYIGITDDDGKLYLHFNKIDNTKPLSITVYKTGCLTYRNTIAPYMWSHSNKATGPNNSNSIIRDGDSLFMVYSLYDPYAPGSPLQQRRVIGAVSDNDGEWWQVYDLGYGRNTSLDKLQSLATPDVFWDEVAGYQYSGGGYTDPTTISNGSAWVEPGSMWADDVDTSYLQAAGISYLYATSPALIHMQIPRGDVENTIVDTLIDKDGISAGNDNSYLVIPAHNPSIALDYNDKSKKNDIVIAFEDKNSEICQIRYSSNSDELLWYLPVRRSNSLSLKSTNPHADASGNIVSLVWQEEVSPNSDNYRIYLNDDRFFMDTSETNKEYPKIKRNSYISYVEEGNELKMWYYSTEDTLEKNILTLNNPIYYPDFDIKLTEIRPKTFQHDIYLMYTEAAGEIYRIKTYHDYFTTDSSDVGMDYELTPTDTQIVVNDSPLYSYLPSSYRRPVERLSSTIKGLNSSKYYDVRIISTNNNKTEPYVFMLDNNESVVIYGKESDTIIRVPSEYISDNALTLSLDRTMGSPNRTAVFKVYGYDEVAGAGASATNTIQFNSKSPISSYQFKVTSNPVIKNSAVKMTVELTEETIVRVSIYDIMGREVKGMNKKLSMGINTLDIDTDTPLSGGVYFIKVTAGSNSYTDKLINLR